MMPRCKHGYGGNEYCPSCDETKEKQEIAAVVKEKLAPNVDAILTERGSRYGPFIGHAAVTQQLKEVATKHLYHRGKVLAPDQQEALDMIFHKIGRIINGDPDYDDSWVDIAGYAQLVADRLQGKER